VAALIAYRNWADTATLTGSSLAGYPLTNLQTRQLKRVWRASSALGAQRITVDLGVAKFVDVVALLNINASALTTSSAYLEYSADGATWSNANIVIPGDAGVPDLPRSIIARVPPLGGLPQFVRWLRLTAQWARPPGVNYYEAGRLYISPALILPTGPDAGYSVGARDPSQIDESVDIQVYVDPKSRTRRLSMTFRALPTLIAYGIEEAGGDAFDVPSLQDLQMAAGKSADIIVAPRADSPLWLRRTGIYGRLESEVDIRQVAGPNYATEITVLEER